MANTLFDKIWDAHVVQLVEDGPTQLYIDRLYCHEVTSPQAFAGMRARGLKCFRPEQIYCMPDHNTPTHDQDKPIEDLVSKTQVDTLEQNAKNFGLNYFGMMHPKNGIIHVVGPERGLTLPGMTIVCGAEGPVRPYPILPAHQPRCRRPARMANGTHPGTLHH